MNSSNNLPSWIPSQLYNKALELQELCKQLQYPGTIICDPTSVNFALNVGTSYTTTFTASKNPLARIMMELIRTSTKQIFPVYVPVTVNTPWEKCFVEITTAYRKATTKETYNRIHALAYGYHLEALLLDNPYYRKPIKANRLKAWKRTYILFNAIGYQQIYYTEKLTLKTIGELSETRFNKLVDFCRWYKSQGILMEQNS